MLESLDAEEKEWNAKNRQLSQENNILRSLLVDELKLTLPQEYIPKGYDKKPKEAKGEKG